MKRAFLVGALMVSLMPMSAHAENPDLAISASNISFSTQDLYANDTIRIYASVRNVGDVDVTGYVYFYQGSMPIGRSQTISLRAGGAQDEVFVDFTVPTGAFNIRAIIQGSSPQDINPDNDVAVTALFDPIVDADRDGAIDESDNCVSTSNADQSNIDGDASGDACDSDIDGDGVSNDADIAPTDPSVSAKPPVVPPPTVVAPATTTETESADSAQAETSTAAAPTSSSSSSTTSSTSSASTSASTSTASTDGDAATSASSSTATTQATELAKAVSKLKISPNARFTYRQIDWRTYEFTIARQPEDSVEFSWDFGDGSSSVQPQITHTFSGSGTYVVTLNILDQVGNRASDAQTLEISFFHLSNPLVQLILGALFVLLAALGIVAYKMHRRLKSV